jgi:hypothetical protein
MKFLTIRQPWASLIAVGAKQIETRPFSTTYRGPLAIHAGKAIPECDNLGGEFGIDVMQHHPFAQRFEGANCVLEPGDFYAYRRPNPPGKVDTFWPLPLGAVVAVCDLIDVVPIHDTCTDPIPDDLIYTTVDGRALYRQIVTGDPGIASNVRSHDLTDQLPFGDFIPGRFAWLLDNVRPIDPVPMKGAQGLRDLPADILERIR